MNRFDLTGSTALVIGASSGGLGAAAARALAQHGARVAVADIPTRGDDLAVTAGEAGPGATQHMVDVTDADSVNRLVEQVLTQHGRLDIVVNAAGLTLRKAYDETTPAEFERIIAVNLFGTWLVGRAAGMALTAQGTGGRIVNLTTVYAERVGPVPESAYYASKAGVVNVTRSLASELGPHNIMVNCLAPGVFYPTRMTQPLADDPERLTWFANRTMLGRLGDPTTDIAGPLLLLCSPASSYMTGQVIYVDGGWSAW